MPVELTSFIQDPIAASAEVQQVTRIAQALLTHLRTPEAEASILAAN